MRARVTMQWLVATRDRAGDEMWRGNGKVLICI
jgi:hypothetical protein